MQNARDAAIRLFEAHHYATSNEILTVAQLRARAVKLVDAQLKSIARMDRKALKGYLDGLPETPATIAGKISRMLALAGR